MRAGRPGADEPKKRKRKKEKEREREREFRSYCERRFNIILLAIDKLSIMMG